MRQCKIHWHWLRLQNIFSLNTFHQQYKRLAGEKKELKYGHCPKRGGEGFRPKDHRSLEVKMWHIIRTEGLQRGLRRDKASPGTCAARPQPRCWSRPCHDTDKIRHTSSDRQITRTCLSILPRQAMMEPVYPIVLPDMHHAYVPWNIAWISTRQCRAHLKVYRDKAEGRWARAPLGTSPRRKQGHRQERYPARDSWITVLF